MQFFVTKLFKSRSTAKSPVCIIFTYPPKMYYSRKLTFVTWVISTFKSEKKCLSWSFILIATCYTMGDFVYHSKRRVKFFCSVLICFNRSRTSFSPPRVILFFHDEYILTKHNQSDLLVELVVVVQQV